LAAVSKDEEEKNDVVAILRDRRYAAPQGLRAGCVRPRLLNNQFRGRNLRGSPRRSRASTLKALEHSSSVSPSDNSRARKCRQIRADIASSFAGGVAVLLIAGEVDDVVRSHYDFFSTICCPSRLDDSV